MEVTIKVRIPDDAASTKEEANERVEFISMMVGRALRELTDDDPRYTVEIKRPDTSGLPPLRGSLK